MVQCGSFLLLGLRLHYEVDNAGSTLLSTAASQTASSKLSHVANCSVSLDACSHAGSGALPTVLGVAFRAVPRAVDAHAQNLTKTKI